ncbi:MAG TPA: efflux RND transporter permease subunit [Burkholderiaceae bacterium]
MNASPWSLPALALLTPLGLIGVQGLSMDLQTIQVSATLRGAVPARFEVDIGRRIERRLTSLGQLDHVATLVTDGSVAISASFARGKNGAQALSEVRQAVDSVCADLPPGIASPATTSAFMSYRIRSFALGAMTPRNANWPGIVRGGCPLAAWGRA